MALETRDALAMTTTSCPPPFLKDERRVPGRGGYRVSHAAGIGHPTGQRPGGAAVVVLVFAPIPVVFPATALELRGKQAGKGAAVTVEAPGARQEGAPPGDLVVSDRVTWEGGTGGCGYQPVAWEVGSTPSLERCASQGWAASWRVTGGGGVGD